MPCFVPVQAAFGETIRKLRERSGLRIEQLSEKSGFSTKRLRAIEQGKINLNLGTLLILARSLDVALHDFFEDIARKLRYPESARGKLVMFPKNPGSVLNVAANPRE